MFWCRKAHAIAACQQISVPTQGVSTDRASEAAAAASRRLMLVGEASLNIYSLADKTVTVLLDLPRMRWLCLHRSSHRAQEA